MPRTCPIMVPRPWDSACGAGGVGRESMTGCWLCGSAESEEFLPATLGGQVSSHDFKISDSHYGRAARLVRCRKCGFHYADPLPAEDLIRLYAGLVDLEYSEGSEGRIRPFRRILGRCLNLLPGARTVLDIGANDCTLLKAYKIQGIKRVGIDPTGKKFAESLNMSAKASRRNALFGGFSRTMRQILQNGIMCAGAYLVLRNEMTAGMIPR